MWRRALPGQPQLPLVLPVQLQSSVTQLTSAIRAHVDQGPAQPTGQAPFLPEQLSALKQRIDAAQAITSGSGSFQIEDDGLWDFINAALARAANRTRRTGSSPARADPMPQAAADQPCYRDRSGPLQVRDDVCWLHDAGQRLSLPGTRKAEGLRLAG
jgi:hypothetical protein